MYVHATSLLQRQKCPHIHANITIISAISTMSEWKK